MSVSAHTRAPLIVISGPSGVGKTAVVEQVLRSAKLPLKRAITATTRQPRVGEIDGVDYYFWKRDRFAIEEASGRMLEAAEYNGNRYGTPLTEADGEQIVLLVIEVQGAAMVRAKYAGEHLSVFLLPPSWEILEARLRNRGTEDDAKVSGRLRTARIEWERRNEFDVRLTNDRLGDTVRALEALIREQFTARGLSCTTT